MTVAVVMTATAGRSEHLRRALRALDRQTDRPDEIVVVRMDDGELDIDARPDGPVVVDASPASVGPLPLGAARNLGALTAAAERIVFLDVDCIASPDTVRRYADVLVEHPRVLACGPVRYLAEGWQHDLAASALDPEVLRLASAPHPARPGSSEPGVVTLSDRHELFWSLSFGVARSTWVEVGGFDEGFVGYGAEDTDLAFRARQLGFPLAWFDGGAVFHQWHPPTRLDPSRAAEIVANATRFRGRWGVWPMTGWLRELDGLGVVTFDEQGDSLVLRPC